MVNFNKQKVIFQHLQIRFTIIWNVSYLWAVHCGTDDNTNCTQSKKTNKQVPHSYWLFQVDLLMNNMWFRFPAHVLISFDSLLPYLPLLPPRGFRCWWSGTWGPFSLAAVPLCFYILTGLGIDSHLWMNPFFTFDSFTWVNSYIVINKNMSTLYGFQWWCLFLGGGVIPN